MTATFEDLGDLPKDVLDAISGLGWTTPMPVQEEAIASLLAGRDLVVQAQTGSGKTGAFGIPIVANIDPKIEGTQALILVPTRELASQVCKELAALGKNRGIRCLPIYGGVAYGPQLDGLGRGDHVVVGTPGRIQDHIQSGKFKLDKIRILVMDEADEMLSQGFWPDMQKIQSYLPKKRQSCLFSATMPERVKSLSRTFLVDPEMISLSEDDLAPQLIEHQWIQCRQGDKETVLVKLFAIDQPDSAIIFCNTKADVRFVTQRLKQRGLSADQISGDLSQDAREKALKKLRTGKLNYLVATDVAARGIDISDLTMVVSYATPEIPEIYVHRTGRTGRAGKKGVAVSLVSGLDIGNFRYMQNVNGIKVKERKLPKEIPEPKTKPATPITDDEAKPTLETAPAVEAAPVAVVPETTPPATSPPAASQGEESTPLWREKLMASMNDALSKIPETERESTLGPFLELIDSLVKEDEGRQKLAALCAASIESERQGKSRKRRPRKRSSGEGDSKPGSSRGRRPSRRGPRNSQT